MLITISLQSSFFRLREITNFYLALFENAPLKEVEERKISQRYFH